MQYALLLLLLIAPALAPAATPEPAAALTVRRVNAAYYPQTVDFSTAGSFWFGRLDVGQIPGNNYSDVRVAYTPNDLQVFVAIADYYLWFEENPGTASDPTQYTYDGISLYIDALDDRSAAPDTNDYVFQSKLVAFQSDTTNWKRQAQGTGSGWNGGFAGAWNYTPGVEWSCNPGPNSNSCGIDYGWAATFRIPWSTIGLTGPPNGSTIGMGLQLFDRDAPGGGGLAPVQTWPEALNPAQPATWGQVGFAVTSYRPPLARAGGTVTVQRGLPGSTVIDSTVGDDGNCGAGHEGNPDSPLKPSDQQITQGEDTSLYIGSEAVMTHLPCFGRGYLRFNLNQVPPGKVIISAQLTLYHWSQSGDLGAANEEDRPKPSYIRLYHVDGGWGETTVTWNNGPRAKQDLGGVWVTPRQPGGSLFPGIPYTWNATNAVADAYANSTPVDLALYTPDTNRNTLKYFTSSETGDWNAVARPKLTITWGDPVAVESQLFLPYAGR